MTLHSDEVIQPDGVETTFDVVERNDFVVVIAKKDNKFLLVDQYRYPIKKRSLEFVQGGLEDNENPQIGAERELTEETGMTSQDWKKLGYIYLANGNQTQAFYIYLAENCIEGARTVLGEEADLVMKEYSEEQLKQMISDGTIHDSPTLAAYCKYFLLPKSL